MEIGGPELVQKVFFVPPILLQNALYPANMPPESFANCGFM